MEDHGYSVVRALGGGGCNNRVYEVRSADGHIRVVKQLPWQGDKEREHALLEVRLLASLRHPCIVHYIETFLIRSTPSMPMEDVLCLVMSRCERDLRQECLRLRMEAELLQEEPPPQSGETDQRRPPYAQFAEAQVLSWLVQLCWGLQHLHSRKFLHRDLKPQNVLMSHNSTRVLLADFGIAAQVESTEGLRSSIVGTPAFMSPEMLEGRPYGLKTDQWALGCVLFEMMALEPPFASKRESYAAVVSAVLHAPPIRAPPGFSPELGQTMEALLARKPHNRPSNRDLLRGALLREPFQTFVQGLQGEWRAAAGSPAASPAEASPAACSSDETECEAYLDGRLGQGSPDDSLHLPSVGVSPATSPTVTAGLTARGTLDLDVPECIEEAASYASDFTSLSDQEGSDFLPTSGRDCLPAGSDQPAPMPLPTSGLPPITVSEASWPCGDVRGQAPQRSPPLQPAALPGGMPGHVAPLCAAAAPPPGPPPRGLPAAPSRPVARFEPRGQLREGHLPLLREEEQPRPKPPREAREAGRRRQSSSEVGLPCNGSMPSLAPALAPLSRPTAEEIDWEVYRYASEGSTMWRNWHSDEVPALPAVRERTLSPEGRDRAASGCLQGAPGRALRHHGALPEVNRTTQFSWGAHVNEMESSGSGGLSAALAVAAAEAEGSFASFGVTGGLPQAPAVAAHVGVTTAAPVAPNLPSMGLPRPGDMGANYPELGTCAASEMGASEWRVLLDEAEALLQSPAEPTGGYEEAQKIRMALAAMLGAPAQVDKALSFLRKRKPLGDTVEADELLLQVELLDLLGEEALHTLPLLEKLQALEANATWAQHSESPELELPSLFP